jgi:aminoglycoside/choline kinase family phosphotransferase
MGSGYDIKSASRDTLEEDLQVVREHLLPRMQQLEAENAKLQGGQMRSQQPPQQAIDTRNAGYRIKEAPRELLEEDIQIVREHLLPRMQQLEAHNAALKAGHAQQQGTEQSS